MTRFFSPNNRPRAGSLNISDEQRPPPSPTRPSRAAGQRPEPASSTRETTSRDKKAPAATEAFESEKTPKTKLTGDTTSRPDGNFYAFVPESAPRVHDQFPRYSCLPLPEPPRDFLRRRERPHARGPTEGPAPPRASPERDAALNEKDPAATRSDSIIESPFHEDLGPTHRKAALRRSGQSVWLHISHRSDGTFLPAPPRPRSHARLQLLPPGQAGPLGINEPPRLHSHPARRRVLMPP